MIHNKNSALIGFGLMVYTLITLIVLIGLVQINTFYAIIGIINLLLNGLVICNIYKKYRTKE